MTDPRIRSIIAGCVTPDTIANQPEVRDELIRKGGGVTITLTDAELRYIIAKLGGDSEYGLIRPRAGAINATDAMALVEKLRKAVG